MHAELQIGDSMMFLADEFLRMSVAVAAGCQAAMPVMDMFSGDRFGNVIDPFGHHWNLATDTEEVAPEEMERRSLEWMAQNANRAAGSGPEP